MRSGIGPAQARLRRLVRDQEGAGIVEAALVLPLVIFLTLGAIETARAIAAKAAMNHAVKETARFAAVRGEASPAEASEAFLEDMALKLADLPTSTATAAVTWDPNNAPGGRVTVQMQHDLTPLALPFLPDPIELSSTASMIVIR
jgi:Flp pilus assembly protein TadG